MTQDTRTSPLGLDPLRDPFQGLEVAGCRLEERIGRGGVAIVFRAMHLALHQTRAVKAIDCPDETKRIAMLREARIAAKLRHPNIVLVHDVAEAVVEGRPHLLLVMEHMDLGTVGQYVRTNGRLSLYRATYTIAKAAQALLHAHRNGYVHGDIKVDNLLLSRDGAVKVADFGLARKFEGPIDIEGSAEEDVRPQGCLVGTPLYMAPEQWRGEPATPRSDLYALGVVYYYLVTGRRPYEGKTVQTIYRAFCRFHDQRLEPRDLDPTVPPAVNAIIVKLIAADPEDRYRGTGEALRDLLAVLRSLRHAPDPRERSGDTIPSGILSLPARTLPSRFHSWGRRLCNSRRVALLLATLAFVSSMGALGTTLALARNDFDLGLVQSGATAVTASLGGGAPLAALHGLFAGAPAAMDRMEVLCHRGHLEDLDHLDKLLASFEDRFPDWPETQRLESIRHHLDRGRLLRQAETRALQALQEGAPEEACRTQREAVLAIWQELPEFTGLAAFRERWENERRDRALAIHRKAWLAAIEAGDDLEALREGLAILRLRPDDFEGHRIVQAASADLRREADRDLEEYHRSGSPLPLFRAVEILAAHVQIFRDCHDPVCARFDDGAGALCEAVGDEIHYRLGGGDTEGALRRACETAQRLGEALPEEGCRRILLPLARTVTNLDEARRLRDRMPQGGDLDPDRPAILPGRYLRVVKASAAVADQAALTLAATREVPAGSVARQLADLASRGIAEAATMAREAAQALEATREDLAWEIRDRRSHGEDALPLDEEDRERVRNLEATDQALAVEGIEVQALVERIEASLRRASPPPPDPIAPGED